MKQRVGRLIIIEGGALQPGSPVRSRLGRCHARSQRHGSIHAIPQRGYRWLPMLWPCRELRGGSGSCTAVHPLPECPGSLHLVNPINSIQGARPSVSPTQRVSNLPAIAAFKVPVELRHPQEIFQIHNYRPIPPFQLTNKPSVSGQVGMELLFYLCRWRTHFPSVLSRPAVFRNELVSNDAIREKNKKKKSKRQR